jgi:hypothetical protein
MKKIGNIFVIVAGALLLLHSLLPHAHHSQLNNEQHIEEQQTATSLFDYLQLAFHFNPGENHLEEYQTAGDELLSISPFLVAVIEFSFLAPLLDDFNDDFYPEQSDIKGQYLYRHLSFRGPPQLS